MLSNTLRLTSPSMSRSCTSTPSPTSSDSDQSEDVIESDTETASNESVIMSSSSEEAEDIETTHSQLLPMSPLYNGSQISVFYYKEVNNRYM